TGLQHARGLAPWQDLAAACERAARDLRLVSAGVLREVRGTLKLRWTERAGRADFSAALAALAQACGEAARALDGVADMAPDFSKLAERARSLAALAEAFCAPAAEAHVRW